MNESAFTLFGASHLAILLTILALCVLISRVPRDPARGLLALVLAGCLAFIVILKPIFYIGVYGEPWGQSLPLDLCRINEMMCIYMLLARSYRVFEVSYFLTLAGSVSALLMPDLAYGFPDARFLMFFYSHGLAVLAVLYAICGYGFRPTLRSVGITLVFLGIYTLIMAGVNIVLDANYLFLREKPEGASVLDFFGPWPIYVILLIALAIVLCFVLYLPVAWLSRRDARREMSPG
jgi:hypothetical integral membrane protein (TIGR02206 family)